LNDRQGCPFGGNHTDIDSSFPESTALAPDKANKVVREIHGGEDGPARKSETELFAQDTDDQEQSADGEYVEATSPKALSWLCGEGRCDRHDAASRSNV
jgi:hypothetical protein